MKKFLVEPQQTWMSPQPVARHVVEQIQFGNQYSNDVQDQQPVAKKPQEWQISGSWVIISDQQGNQQRVPGEQVVQELLRQNQDLRAQITRMQQEHREMQGKLSQLTTAIRQRT